MKKPNIVFFFTDDQRFDTIAALGNKAIKTPNIDFLTTQGTAFTRAHIPGGSCPAVCMPSRAMLHTGKTLFAFGDSGKEIPGDYTLMGEHLRANGYRTFGTGKWHNGKQAFNRSFDHGDEIFFGGMADHWNVPVHHYDPSGKYDSRLPQVLQPGQNRDVTWRNCDHINAGHHSSEMVCDAAIDFIENSPSDDPFFTYIAFLAPHDPRVMPEEFRTMYDPAEVELPENFTGGHPFETGALHIRDELLAEFPRNPEEIKTHIAEYYGMISHLDHQLGRVIRCLQEQGLFEETIFIFAGDNGLAVGQHGLMGKQNMYDHSIRVPLVFAGPGIPAGERKEDYVYLLDIFPTLCDLLELDIPASVEGLSLMPSLRGEKAGRREALYFAYMEFQRAVKKDEYKLIEYVYGGKPIRTQLFDLSADPLEMEDLSERPEYASRLETLRAEMLRQRDLWNDGESTWGRTFWSGYGAH